MALLCEEVSSSSSVVNANAKHNALVGPRRDEKIDTSTRTQAKVSRINQIN